MAPGTEVASLAAAIEAVEHLKARKGAFRIALIPPEVLHALNDGLIETVNLNEFLALCLLYTSPSPRDKRQSRMPSSA